MQTFYQTQFDGAQHIVALLHEFGTAVPASRSRIDGGDKPDDGWPPWVWIVVDINPAHHHRAGRELDSPKRPTHLAVDLESNLVHN